jgi:hypothetical protein
MVMGDLVMAEDEINPVMSKLLDSGITVTCQCRLNFPQKCRLNFPHFVDWPI